MNSGQLKFCVFTLMCMVRERRYTFFLFDERSLKVPLYYALSHLYVQRLRIVIFYAATQHKNS